MFPGRRHAGRIFFTEVQLSGSGAAGLRAVRPERGRRRLHPGLLRRGDHARRQRLDVPRLAAHGRDGDRREGDASRRWAGARMHTGVSGCGHFLVESDEEGIDVAKRYLSLLPSNWREEPPHAPPAEPARDWPEVPEDENKPFDMYELIDALVDADSFLEVQRRWAKELVVGYARLDGRAIGIVANQPKQRGGRAVRRLLGQGGALHLDLQRVQRAAALPGRRAGLHDRHPGRAPGDHPRGGQDDLRRVGGHRAEDLGDREEGLRRGPLRDGRPRLRAGRLPGAARRPRSR